MPGTGCSKNLNLRKLHIPIQILAYSAQLVKRKKRHLRAARAAWLWSGGMSQPLRGDQKMNVEQCLQYLWCKTQLTLSHFLLFPFFFCSANMTVAELHLAH